MYYIYHIEGIKVGCTNNPVKRIKIQQGYSDYKILAKTKNIDEACKLEFEWQDKLGYKRDIRTYKETINNFKTKKMIHVTNQTITFKKTFNNKKLQINLALNYGSKEEIINACKNLKKRKMKITERNIEDNMYTKNIPNPDLLIRTGNTNRLSNFLLWQVAYTEIFFIKKLWPEFNTNDYKKILNKFRLLKRNFGSI